MLFLERSSATIQLLDTDLVRVVCFVAAFGFGKGTTTHSAPLSGLEGVQSVTAVQLLPELHAASCKPASRSWKDPG